MKDFVSFEIAKKLKEKGFKEKCIAYYWEKINEHTPSFVVEDNMPDDGLNILDLLSNHNQVEYSPFIDAPTISQVLKWMRKKNVHLYTDIDKEGWFFEIRCLKTRVMINTDFFKRHSTYELAALAGIEYCLDNLI